MYVSTSAKTNSDDWYDNVQTVHNRQEVPGDHHGEPEQSLLHPGQL